MLRDNPLQGMAIIAKLKYGVSADPYDGNNESRLTEHAGGECAKRGQTINQDCIDRGVLDWDCRQRHNPNPNETPDQCIERRLAAGPSWSGLPPAAKPQGAVSAPPKPTEAPRVEQDLALGDDPDAAGEESAEDASEEPVTDESTEPAEQSDSSAEESGESPEEAATDTGDMDEPSDTSESADDESTAESSAEWTDESSGDEDSNVTADDADAANSEEAEERS